MDIPRKVPWLPQVHLMERVLCAVHIQKSLTRSSQVPLPQTGWVLPNIRGCLERLKMLEVTGWHTEGPPGVPNPPASMPASPGCLLHLL